jgi:nicotinamide mononucleotide (NMN) deamidase PncC
MAENQLAQVHFCQGTVGHFIEACTESAMDGAARALITSLHATSTRCILAVTGGGASVAGQLLSVAGASRTILEIQVPYSDEALAEFLGRRPDSYCSADTARAMASRAYDRARWMAPGLPVIGISCTASLRSDRPKKGDHRFHLAARASRSVVTRSVTLVKDARSREEEDVVVSAAILNLLAETVGINERVPAGLLPDEHIVADTEASGLLSAFLSGKLACLRIEPDGRIAENVERPLVLLPGSFNPLHHGHVALAAITAAWTRQPVCFEMTVENADKPALDDAEVRHRLAQFAWQAPIWLTRAATFPAKARLFPGATFVVGADTAARIVDPRFYGGSDTARDIELAEFRLRGCRFLVAGRADANGRFLGLEDLVIPEGVRDLFSGIPVEQFRLDVSSTELRANKDP